MPSKAGGAGRGGTQRSGFMRSPAGRAPSRVPSYSGHVKPVGARERGTPIAYGQQQSIRAGVPIHVAAAATPPATTWSDWFRGYPAELQATRGLFGRLPGPRPATHTPWERFPAARKKLH